MGYVLDITYDPAVIKPERPVFAWGSSGEFSTEEQGKLKLIWSGSENNSENGLLVTVLFTVSTKAESGTYDIGISYSEEDTFNENYESVKLSCTGTSITVSAGEPKPTIYSNNIETTVDDVFDMPIFIGNNTGIEDMSRVDILYDASKFEYMGYTETITGAVIRTSRTGNGSNAQIRILLSEINSSVPDGELLRLQFRALDTSEGTNDIELYLDDANWASEGCTIYVSKEEKQALICSDAMTAIIGEPAEIPIKICNNPGLLGFRLKVSYDKDVFAVDDVTAGNAWNGLLEFNDNGEGQIDVLGTATSENSEDGIIITLKLLVKDDAPFGDTPIAIAVDSESTFDEELNELSFQVENALITIADYGEVILAKGGSSTIINNGFIYGLSAGCTSLNDYIEAKDGFTLEYDTTARIGTGLTVCAKKNDKVVETCVVIIFGDVNSDGWYDGQDSILVNCIVNGLLTREQIGEVKYMAADCNHDGEINEADVALLEQAGILLANVDQTMIQEELLETDSYIEYLNLIDQNPTVDEEITDEPITPTAKTLIERIIEIVKTVITFIRSLFPKI